jgi:tRNA nucleotidyltransferase (CCA-adding enzyme)
MDKVAEIMSYGVKTIAAAAGVSHAAEEMRRLGHEGYPVVDDDGRLVGLLTRRAVDRALGHELDHLPVRQIMRAGKVTVTPGDSIERVQQLMIEEGWGQIPVVSETDTARLIGIVTRTDLLNLLSQPARTGRQTDMRRLMQEMLSPSVWQMVQAISRTAAERGVPIYFVGGLVRDMLLGKRSVDIDIVVEGEAIALVEQLRSRLGGTTHTHARFGTAKWAVDDSVWERAAPGGAMQELPESLDFVTARTEFYAHPTALPEVARSSIKLDLHRRDFTINTLAVRLDGAHLGQMLDFYGGQRDLEQKLVRVLHSLSFIDDPTRILRAVRLEQRLGFEIEERTAELLADALPMLVRITGDRVRHELQLALQEPDPAPIMSRLNEVGVFGALHSRLSWSEEMATAFRRVPACVADPLWRADLREEDTPVIYFVVWLLHMPAAVQDAIMDRLRVRQHTRADVMAARELLALLREMPADIAPSEATRAIRPHMRRARVLPIVAAMLGEGGRPHELLTRYQADWRHVAPDLDGHDLLALGMAPGPELGDVLEALLAARLDGESASAAEDRALALQLMARFARNEEE